ncbi:hypothetical protein KH5_19790 [Urechidicola sp. KH5]
MKKGLKRIIKKTVSSFGYKIQKLETPTVRNIVDSNYTMEAALKRCITRGLTINTIIDVGASDGRWSRRLLGLFPDANFLLIEAQIDHKKGLEVFKKEIVKGDYVLAAAGEEDGKIYFDHNELFGGVASSSKTNDNCIEVPVISIDNEVERRNVLGPYLLKLDTHGFEVPILKGAEEVIKKSSLIIIEVYNYNITKDSLCFWEMCEYMSELGFRPIEMVDPMIRLYDKSFWQMDLFFIPKTDKTFKYIEYR